MTSSNAPTVSFTVSHPHDVHLFRHAISELSAAGYRTPVFVREKEMTSTLLDAYGIPHMVLGRDHDSKAGLLTSWGGFGLNLLREARRRRPDLMVAEVGAVTTPVSALLGVDNLVFMDAEHATLQNHIVFPLATRICTSTSFWTDVGEKQVRYEGYQELAYLHPDRFEPDPSVLTDAGVDADEPFALVRTVGWNAAHDVNAGGFADLEVVVETLEERGVTALVTSEAPLPEALRSYGISIAPHRIHDLMYYADLYLGESATMATESALLGTPAVYVSTLDVGYASEIEREYGLLFHFAGEDRQRRGLAKAKAILDGSENADWTARRRRLIEDKRDTTDVIVEQVREMTGRPRPTIPQ